jgi:putative oxidoreductase
MYQRMLDVLAVLGRATLASLFMWSGATKIVAPAATAAYMATGGLPASDVLALLVGAFELFAGLALAVGFRVRLMAFSLAGFTLLASVMYHGYWAMEAEQRAVQQLLFSKNLALVGALLLIGVVAAGRVRTAEIDRLLAETQPSPRS